jgi:glycosyltransferase involved in cell wall biosynthesis
MQMLEHLYRPIVFETPELVPVNSAWNDHLPFAFWIVDALRPLVFVELGTHTGASYCAFCQAVGRLSLPTLCYAVDTWKGDEHAGFYGEEVYQTLAAYHEPRYSAFSRLVRSTFDEAVEHFADSSIDLLHIDGLHTYEAVRHDFEAWRPKLSNRAVVLFHDTNVRERGFGVWKLWDELSALYPAFSLIHGYGLGVLAVGADIPVGVRWLVETPRVGSGTVNTVRGFFAELGAVTRAIPLVDALKLQVNKLAESEGAREEANTRLQEANARLQEENARLGEDFKGAREILSRIYGSRGWKVLQLYYRARDKALSLSIRRASAVRESASVYGKEVDGRLASVGQVGSIESKHSVRRTDSIARTGRPKVLLVSGDILPLEGQATTGAGLRIWGLGEGLRSRGYEITYAMPRDVAFKCNYKSDEIRLFDGLTLDSIVRNADADVLVFQHWPWVGALTEHPRGHIVVDFHGPLLMETLFREPMDVERLVGWKLKALSMADYFICAGKKQSYYYLAWLLAAGVDVRKSPIATIPFCLSPDLPTHVAWPEDPVFVYGGVFLPWQDPAAGLHVLIDELDRAGVGSLHFFGGSHPWMELPTDRFVNLRRELKKSKRVQLFPLTARQELVRRYCETSAAWDLMARNPEREMAFTSRTVEYLWCGLPVVYNNYAELSEYIAEYDAGWLVDPVDEAQIRQAIREILNCPEVVRRKGRNAQRLVAERLTWDMAIAPLDMYCQSPYRAGRIAERPLLTKVDGDAGQSFRLKP